MATKQVLLNLGRLNLFLPQQYQTGSKREFNSITGLFQETNKNLNLTIFLKQLEKEDQTKPTVSRKEEIINIRTEIIQRINDTKS